MKKIFSPLGWLLVALLGAWAYARLALSRGETINSIYILIAALCSYAIGYRFYAKWIATRLLVLNDRRAPPCEVHDDGRDFCKTNKWIVFGHHFAAISGPGPLVGPVLSAQFGFLPGTLWILIGVVLGGAVQDFVILFSSMRRNGKSLGQMVKDELNNTAGYIAMIAILSIMVILLAVLGLVVAQALAESPWGVFTVAATIPIAMFMGGYLRFWRVGRVLEVTTIGAALLFLAVWGGKYAHENATLSHLLTLKASTLAGAIIAYGLAASILPVWLLLAPRDYLSTFMKLGTIFALALGIFVMLPDLKMPALTEYAHTGLGLVIKGKLFPFCFVTIACGAISGFHTLIASGTTPKIMTRESYARPIGYGAMCLESLVAIMAMIAACTLEPGVYFSMNMKGDPAATVAQVSAANFPVTLDQMQHEADAVGEKSLFGRTGGGATLAVGMAHIFSRAVGGRALDLWYHFAIMFEALFILTTIDAGTRVGRYLLQDLLGHVWKPLGQSRNLAANLFASVLLVGAWGWFLVQGVNDPVGGINSLWPIFGIANQMLAAVALCLATTIILKMQLQGRAGVSPAQSSHEPDPHPGPLPSDGRGGILGRRNSDGTFEHDRGMFSTSARKKVQADRPLFALVTLVPLIWLVATTFTAGVEKIFHPDPRIGFLAEARTYDDKLPAVQSALDAAQASGDKPAIADAEKALHINRGKRINDFIDTGVVATYLVMVSAIMLISVREWLLLLARRRPATLSETEPVWLPDYAVGEGRPVPVMGMATLLFGLARELSGEAHQERAQKEICLCEKHHTDAEAARVYVEVTERRFNGVNRCC